MAEFDRSCTTSYQSAIVISRPVALSWTILSYWR